MSNKKFNRKPNTSNNGNPKTGKSLKEIYAELEKMSDAEIEARTKEIDEQIAGIREELFDKQTLDEDEIKDEKKHYQEINRLTRKARGLKREKNELAYFPKVKEKLAIIADREEKLRAQKQKELEEAEKKVADLEKKTAEAKEEMDTSDEIEAEILSIQEIIAKMSTKRPKARENYEKQIEDLKQEREKLGNIEDWAKISEETEEAKKVVETYKTRKK